MKVRRRRCFVVPGRIAALGDVHGPCIDESPTALALAKLLPLLGCGEEAAAIAFDELARQENADEAEALATIAAEERVHDALIAHLCDRLPDVSPEPDLLANARRFHASLGAGGTTFHLARIAALDAAICTILGALLRANGPVATDRYAAPALRRIRRDEVNHVRIARVIVAARGAGSAQRDAAAATREMLADILGPIGDAFEALAVDPMRLDRRIRRLPDRLLSG